MSAMQDPASHSQPDRPRLIIDTDMGSDCDDAGALAVSHQLADLGEAEILAIIQSSGGRMPWGIGVCAAINAYYGRPHLALGAHGQTDVGDGVDKVLAGEIARDTTRYGHDITCSAQARDALTLYRETLHAQPDHSVTIVTIGHLKVLHDLWEAEPGLVRNKVRELVVMGGNFPGSGESPEWNFSANDAAAYTHVLEHWPSRVVYTGFEIGIHILTGQGFAQHDPQDTLNPVAHAYHGFHQWQQTGVTQGRPSWDQTAVLYAVRGAEHAGTAYWKLSPPGSISINPRGGNIWTPTAEGNHFYLTEAMPVETLTAEIEALMAVAPRRSSRPRNP